MEGRHRALKPAATAPQAKVVPGRFRIMREADRIRMATKARTGDAGKNSIPLIALIPKASRPPQIDPKRIMPKISFLLSII
jgi:hypothetical protein